MTKLPKASSLGNFSKSKEAGEGKEPNCWDQVWENRGVKGDQGLNRFRWSVANGFD